MLETTISKPVYRVLTDITGQPRFEVALHLATKDLLRLKLKEVEEQRAVFEVRYGMDFESFKQAWDEERIPDRYSYEVERDYWEWEAAVTDAQRLCHTNFHTEHLGLLFWRKFHLGLVVKKSIVSCFVANLEPLSSLSTGSLGPLGVNHAAEFLPIYSCPWKLVCQMMEEML